MTTLQINDARVDCKLNPISVLFDGSVTIWRASTNLDVLIVRHVKFRCVEIVAFDPFTSTESPRIFTDYNKLITKLDKEILARVTREKKELFLRRHEPYDLLAIEQAGIDELITKFLLARLTLEIETKSNEHFYVYLKAQFDDAMVTDKSKLLINGACPDYALDFLIPMPRYLNPVITMHLSKMRASMFLRCLEAFQHNAHLASASSGAATFFLHNSEASLETIKAKRLPLWRQRWIRAIDKVINRNVYAKFLVRLALQQQRDRLAAIKSQLTVDTSTSAAAKMKVMRRAGCPSPQHGIAVTVAGGASSPTSVVGTIRMLSHSRSQDSHHHHHAPHLLPSISADSSPRRPFTSGMNSHGNKFGSPTAAKAASRAVSNSRDDRRRVLTFAPPPIAGATAVGDSRIVTTRCATSSSSHVFR